MDWDDLRIVLAIARSGSITKAAETLRVNHATVSRRLRAIEDRTGEHLFDRVGKQGYSRTKLGEAYVNTALRIEEETLQLERRIAGADAGLSGELRVTIPPPALLPVMPALRRFSAANPAVEVELVCTYDVLNITRREADVALRFTENPPEHLVGRRIGKLAYCVYASKVYLEEHDMARYREDINWIGWEDYVPFPPWLKRTPFPDIPVRHRFGDVPQNLEAARAGYGIAWLPCYAADPVADLTRVPGAEPVLSKAEFWVLSHQDMRRNARIRDFSRMLAAHFEDIQDELLGRCPAA